jgi:hypothetical protein
MKNAIKFLLSHIEDFVDDESKEWRERALNFRPDTGLEKIERLVESDPQAQDLSSRVLERLSAFFEAGLLLQKGPSSEHANWWITDLFWKGNTFHLETGDQIRADHVALEASPLQVHKAPARRLLKTIQLERLSSDQDAQAFLIKPTPHLAYMLISNLPAPWIPDHVAHAQRLINKCFLY